MRAGGVKRGGYLEGSRLIRRFKTRGLCPSIPRRVERPDLSRQRGIYEGDSIHVAQAEDVVYVSGEVYVPSPVLYKERRACGTTSSRRGTTRKRRSRGRQSCSCPAARNGRGGDPPGSSIFVPRKIDKPDNTLQVVANLVTILASLAAITVAVIQVTK